MVSRLGFEPRTLALKFVLTMLGSTANLKDLLAPLSNRLEKLKGDRAGQHSIRINDQWRICFLWRDDGPHEVEITDYH